MNFLKYCDFFDIKFHFYVGGHPSNSNIFGGVMSILFCITAILLIFILSIEDLRKLNPITSKSEVPGADIRIVNLHDSKVWVPWRIVTYEEKFIDHRGILHPVVSFIEGKWNSSFGMDLTKLPWRIKPRSIKSIYLWMNVFVSIMTIYPGGDRGILIFCIFSRLIFIYVKGVSILILPIQDAL